MSMGVVFFLLSFQTILVSEPISPFVATSIHNSPHACFLSERNAENLYTCAAERIHKGTNFPKKTTPISFFSMNDAPSPFLFTILPLILKIL
jgi:hypothetical protein